MDSFIFVHLSRHLTKDVTDIIDTIIVDYKRKKLNRSVLKFFEPYSSLSFNCSMCGRLIINTSRRLDDRKILFRSIHAPCAYIDELGIRFTSAARFGKLDMVKLEYIYTAHCSPLPHNLASYELVKKEIAIEPRLKVL